MVFAGQARTGWAFPDATVGYIAAHHPDLRMVAFNLGVPAHTSFQTLRVLKGEFARTDPDIVVYWGASSDNSPASGYSDRVFALLHGGSMYAVRRAVDRSAFIRWTRTLHGPETEPAIVRPPTTSLSYPRRVDPDHYERNVREMARWCSAHGAHFLALTRQHAKSDRGPKLYNERLEQLAGVGLPLLDVRDMYPTAARDSLMSGYPEDKVHFNEKGYRLVAERTARRIMQEGWIDSLRARSLQMP
ncbi:SGNH/GDSL hydrolase family protein [Candidatus Fermentibacteria bacterium]|nr:SGNH/GDSL hydrolase family protein [Candidatus Fermentibacteria bacterium]